MSDRQIKMIRILNIAAGVLLIFSLLIFIISLMCFDSGFYESEYTRLETAKSIGISEQDLFKATNTLLDYLKDERDDLNVSITIDDGKNITQRQAFNEKEISHMVDVKNLYSNALNVCKISFIISMVIYLCLFIRRRKAQIIPCLKGYINANIVFLSIFAALGVWAAIDFYSFWTCFHKIMFTNDLWLLDPRTDILIQMVPGQFFFDLVFRIAITFVITALVLLGAAIFGVKYARRKNISY